MCNSFNSARPERVKEAPTAFPGFIKTAIEREAITATCETELAAWRAAYAYHHALTTLEAKLRHRKTLEKAHRALHAAWIEATTWTTEDILASAG